MILRGIDMRCGDTLLLDPTRPKEKFQTPLAA